MLREVEPLRWPLTDAESAPMGDRTPRRGPCVALAAKDEEDDFDDDDFDDEDDLDEDEDDEDDVDEDDFEEEVVEEDDA